MSTEHCHYTKKTTLILLNAFAAAVHFISGTLGHYIAKDNEPELILQAPLFEFIANNQTSFIKSIPKTILKPKVFQPVIYVEFITASFHVIYLLALIYPSVNNFITKNIISSNSANALRWIEYGITASMMAAFGNANIGIFDFYFFIKTLTDGVALQMCGFLLELLSVSSEKDKRIANIIWNLGTALNLSSVGILLYQIFASKPHTNLFYYNIVPFSLFFNTFGVVAWLSFKKYRQFADINFAEKWYIILSLCTKISVFWLGFATFKTITEQNGVSAKTAGVNWKYVRYSASYALLGMIALLGARDFMQWRVITSRKHQHQHRQPLELQHGEFYVNSPFAEYTRPIKQSKKKQRHHASNLPHARTVLIL